MSPSNSTSICPICDIPASPHFDYVAKCQQCDLLMSNLSADIGRHAEGIETLRKNNFQKIITKILKLSKKDPHLLEIGCGDGWFLDVCQDYKIKCDGIEPDVAQEVLARHPYIHSVTFPANPKILKYNSYDAIIFNDVFEHLHDLHNILTHCQKLLKKDGLLVINLPNSNGFAYRVSYLLAKLGVTGIFNRLWQKGLCSPHLWYFNDDNLEKIMTQHHYGQLLLKKPLQSLSVKGLWQRTKNIGNPFTHLFIYLIGLVSCLCLWMLPSDIMLHIYKIKHDK